MSTCPVREKEEKPLSYSSSCSWLKTHRSALCAEQQSYRNFSLTKNTSQSEKGYEDKNKNNTINP